MSIEFRRSHYYGQGGKEKSEVRRFFCKDMGIGFVGFILTDDKAHRLEE